MKTLPAIVLSCIVAGGVSVHAADRQFKDLVHAISTEFDAKPMHIPLMGLVNFATHIVRPAGAKHVDIAIWENLEQDDRDGRELAKKVRRAVGEEWKPFVQALTNRDGHDETVLVFMRPEGKDIKMLVTTFEPREATVVQVTLNPEGLRRWIKDPVTSMHIHHRDNDRDNEN